MAAASRRAAMSGVRSAHVLQRRTACEKSPGRVILPIAKPDDLG
jgi:hypothetical protein